MVIVGQTASGKSALAMELAKQFNGEIICADSRTIYKGLDIGTAKPSKKDREVVKHHLLDIVEIDQAFSVAKFKQLANDLIIEICSRGKLPIMVGGTGLYVDAVLFDYQFSSEGSERNPENPRHLKKTGHSNVNQVRSDTLVMGLNLTKEKLKQRIHERVKHMLEHGLVAEAVDLGSRYGWDAPGLQTIGYKEIEDQKDINLIGEQIERNTILYAKRQQTWFKRHDYIQWCSSTEQAKKLVEHFLNSYLLQ